MEIPLRTQAVEPNPRTRLPILIGGGFAPSVGLGRTDNEWEQLMDAARPEETDVPFDPLDVVEHVLNAENLPFDRTDDGDLAFALAGDWKDYEMWFAWRPEGDCLQLCCALDLRTAKSRRNAAYELVSLVNQRTWIGHFEVWPEDGEIVFRHALALPHGERPTLAQAASMIDAAVETADRYYPAFDFMIRGAKRPQDAIDACLFETVGNA